MHEFSICRQIIHEAKKHGEPLSIILEVGELASMTAANLKDHLSGYVDWNIEIIGKEGMVVCRCGYQGKPKIRERGHDFLLIECPACGGNDFARIEGDQIILKSVRLK